MYFLIFEILTIKLLKQSKIRTKTKCSTVKTKKKTIFSIEPTEVYTLSVPIRVLYFQRGQQTDRVGDDDPPWN